MMCVWDVHAKGGGGRGQTGMQSRGVDCGAYHHEDVHYQTSNKQSSQLSVHQSY